MLSSAYCAGEPSGQPSDRTRQPAAGHGRVKEVMVMEWVLPFLLVLGLLTVAAPVGVYFGAVALLWVSGLISGGSSLSRTGFYCPFTKQRVTADFLTETGSDHPSDVVSCSAFAKPHDVRCRKACVGLAETHSVSTALLPRYSLIAGGTAYRVEASAAHRNGDPTPDTDVDRAA
jgi:hypothetical protein